MKIFCFLNFTLVVGSVPLLEFKKKMKIDLHAHILPERWPDFEKVRYTQHHCAIHLGNFYNREYLLAIRIRWLGDTRAQ